MSGRAVVAVLVAALLVAAYGLRQQQPRRMRLALVDTVRRTDTLRAVVIRPDTVSATDAAACPIEIRVLEEPRRTIRATHVMFREDLGFESEHSVVEGHAAWSPTIIGFRDCEGRVLRFTPARVTVFHMGR